MPLLGLIGVYMLGAVHRHESHVRLLSARRRSLKVVRSLGKPAASQLEGLHSIHCMPLAEAPVRRTQSIDSYLARSTGESVTTLVAESTFSKLKMWHHTAAAVL